MSDLRKIKERYMSDPAFHAIVSALYQAIDQLKLSPSEVRDAAMLAVYIHEMENPKPFCSFMEDQ